MTQHRLPDSLVVEWSDVRSDRSGPTVSAVVYSRNEAALLPTCLVAITGFDEVLVCNMQSTDSTVEVATHFGARVVDVPDARVIEEVRQRGLDAAASDWVLFVDADEILPSGFSQHIRILMRDAERDKAAAFRLRYTNVAFGHILTNTLVGSAKFALMRQSTTQYPTPGRAHVPPDFDGPTHDAPRWVPEILHLNFRAADQMLEKVIRYAADAPGEQSLLNPFGLLRQLARDTIFSGSWRDGYAGVAVTTAAVFGRWYGALLVADSEGRLDGAFVPRTERRLSAATRVHRAFQWTKCELTPAIGRLMARKTDQ